MEQQRYNKDKLSMLFFVLAAFLIGNALLAELIGSKIFSVNKLLHIPPEGFSLFGSHLLSSQLNMSIGILMWPLVFILSDLVNEYFGKKGVKRISLVTAILIAYSSVILISASEMPPADFWLSLNSSDPDGNPMNINHAWTMIFRQSVGIIFGSITAFLLGQLIDAYTFHWLRKVTGHKALWLRATGSTVISQVIDSFVVLFIAFFILGNWSMSRVLEVGIVQYAYKVTFAVVLTPLIYLIHFIIDKYLGKKESEGIIEETDQNW
jgi:queuosine precursor transporter